MGEWRDMAKLLDSCYSLFLQEIGESRENVLRLLLVESKVNQEAKSMEVGGAVIEGLHRIQPTNESRMFEMIWDQYIVYSVTNESFATDEGEEKKDSGRLLRCYSRSPFLDYVARTTVATAEYPGPYNHLRVVTEMHIVDVVSTTIPTVRVSSHRNC